MTATPVSGCAGMNSQGSTSPYRFRSPWTRIATPPSLPGMAEPRTRESWVPRAVTASTSISLHRVCLT